MFKSRAFFNAVAIFFVTAVLSPVASFADGIPKLGFPGERLFQPPIPVCERLATTVSANTFQTCTHYRAPTVQQAAENIAACFATESNRLTNVGGRPKRYGWYEFCARITSRRDVRADEILGCFQPSSPSRDLQDRVDFETCIDGVVAAKLETP